MATSKSVFPLAALIAFGARPSIAAAPESAVATDTRSTCKAVPEFEAGEPRRNLCEPFVVPEMAVLDLEDDWVPAVFSEERPALPQPYRATFVALANERAKAGQGGELAGSDRYYELFGIFPSLSVVRRRLLDEPRHACHAAIDDQALRAVTTAGRLKVYPALAGASRSPALSVAQAHLRCDGMLADRPSSDGLWDDATRDAVALYQRRHMLPLSVALDQETRETFLTPSRELDFRTLLRVLRERVVDATGLIEDGSAQNAWEPVLGRFIDSAEYRRPLRPTPLEGGAPDLIARATAAAAQALGWTSPEAARERIANGILGRVAVRLPPGPVYHGPAMQLRVEIDRGDVWTSYPLDAEGSPRRSPAKNRPTLTLVAQTDGGDVPLVRWPTTIGSWKPEKMGEEPETLRYKASPVGRFYWRDLVAAPAWFPPPTTPDRELVRRRPGGGWTADQLGVGPGYRSAYGLIALLHHRAVTTSGGAMAFGDVEIRTHGSGSYRSILSGSSHGCHRLFNHLALRLGSFLLAHHENIRRGAVNQRYERTIEWRGERFRLRAASRGYRFELDPPIPVDVLPGRAVHSRAPRRPPPADEPKAVGDRPSV